MPAKAPLILQRRLHQPLHLRPAGDGRIGDVGNREPAAVLGAVGGAQPLRGLLVGPSVLGLGVAGGDAVEDLIERRERIELLVAGDDHVVVAEREHRRARRAGAHRPLARRLGELRLRALADLLQDVGRLDLVLEQDFHARDVLALDAGVAVGVGIAFVHRGEPVGERQVGLGDAAAPELLVGDRVAQTEKDVVRLNRRVGVREPPGGGPGRLIVQALRAGAADVRVLARIVEPHPVELEQHLRDAAMDLRIVQRGDDGIGDAPADHVGLPGARPVVAVVGDQPGVGGGLGAVVELDPEIVVAVLAIVGERMAVVLVRGRRERAPGAVGHHSAEGRRMVGELENQRVVGVRRAVVLAVASGVGEIAGGGIAAENDVRRRALAELDAGPDPGHHAFRLRRERARQRRQRDAGCDLDEGFDRKARQHLRAPEAREKAGAGERHPDRGDAEGGPDRGDRGRDGEGDRRHEIRP